MKRDIEGRPLPDMGTMAGIGFVTTIVGLVLILLALVGLYYILSRTIC